MHFYVDQGCKLVQYVFNQDYPDFKIKNTINCIKYKLLLLFYDAYSTLNYLVSAL